jgi:DNA-directed RNA polymerase subunit RPC12/RpoP
MAKRNKEVDEIEQLRKEIRELKSINRALTRQLKKLSKGQHRLVDLEDELKEALLEQEVETKTEKNSCKDCGSGRLEDVDLGVRNIQVCRDCGWRSITKKARKKKEETNSS